MIARLNGFDRDVLVVLTAYDEVPGVDVHRELETYYGTEVNHSRLYQALDRLTGKGLIEKREKAVDARTNTYGLTPEGRDMIQDHIFWGRVMSNDVTQKITR